VNEFDKVGCLTDRPELVGNHYGREAVGCTSIKIQFRRMLGLGMLAIGTARLGATYLDYNMSFFMFVLMFGYSIFLILLGAILLSVEVQDASS